MQHSGTIRKRRRRNIAKVTGLTTIPYNEHLDTFTGRELFDNSWTSSISSANPFSTRNRDDTRLQFSAKEMMEYRREASSLSHTRVTRNPAFHNELEDYDYERETIYTAVSTIDDLGPFEKRRHLDSSIKNRSRFIDKYSMQRLKQIIWLGIFSGSFPWKWNETEYTIENWNSCWVKLWWVQWFFVTIQTFCLAGFQLYAFLKSFKAHEHESFREVFMSTFSFLWYSYALMLNLTLFIYKEKMQAYIKVMFQFNYVNVQKYLIHLDDYKDGGRLVINLACISNLVQVAVSVTLFLNMPNAPWYLYSYISHLLPMPGLWKLPFAFQEFMVVGQVITAYLLISWLAVVHANTVQFWLREIHNHNDSDYTSEELRNPKVAFELYRSLEILNKLYNECMAPMAIPFMKLIITTAMVPCGYVLIRSMNHKFVDEFPGILTYPLGVIDCATVGFVILSMGAEVFDLGCSFVDSWSLTKQKDFRRFLISCPSIKMWVGRFYFVTMSTTITFFKVCFDYITDCIITFP